MISCLVHVEEATSKGHYAPRFNSSILITPIKLWFRDNAAAKYIRGHQWNPVPCHLG